MTIDEMIAVLQAAKDGKQIQCRTRRDYNPSSLSDWIDCTHGFPQWSFNSDDYRVKPEPREGYIHPCYLATESRFPEAIKVREVL